MDVRLSSFFKLYRLTPGRRIFALRQLRRRAEARNLTALLPDIDRAIALNQSVFDVRALRLQRTARNPRPIDREIDRLLGIVYGRIASFADDPSIPELAALAGELLNILFPEGLGAHTHLPYMEQATANGRVLAALADTAYQPIIAQIGIQPLIEQLRALHEQFSEAVSVSRSRAQRGINLQDDMSRGHELYIEVVVKVLAQFPGDADAAVRADLLDPILVQNEEIRLYRRRRRRAAEIDPATGEPTDDSPSDVEDEDAVEAEADTSGESDETEYSAE